MRPWLPAACAALLANACAPAPTPSPAPPKPAAPVAPAPAAPPASPAQQEAKPGLPAETWVLPGSLGPLTTRLQLDTRFGQDNVREVTLHGTEGIGTYPALVVFPDDPRRRLELVLDAENPDAPIRELRISARDSLWHDASGLRPGISLARLVALNGAPVSFYGLGWDYGGTVSDWHGGSLANTVGNPVFRRVPLSALHGGDDAALPTGDTTFRSDDAKWPTIGQDLLVAELGISWPGDGDE